MKYQLTSLSVTRLTNADFDSFIDSQLIDLSNNLPPSMDNYQSAYQQYITNLTSRHTTFHHSQQQVQISTSARAIQKADRKRDLAYGVYARLVEAGLHSDLEDECQAADLLHLLLKKYKGITRLNYDAETSRMDNLIEDLEGNGFAPYVATLELKRYTDRLKAANNAFKKVVSDRANAEFVKITYDTAMLRYELMELYAEFAIFAQSLANLPDGGYFRQVLTIINNVRDRYANRLSKRHAEAETTADEDVANA